jgi:hypothetical protein
MCDMTRLDVTLRDDIAGRLKRAPAPCRFEFVDYEGWVYCNRLPPFRLGDTRFFLVGNGGCGCGAWEISGSTGGDVRGRFLPVNFLSHFLSMEAVAYVGILWWWSSGVFDYPLEPPQRWLNWSEFTRDNDRAGLRRGLRYLIADSRSELSRTWPMLEQARPSPTLPDPGSTLEKTLSIVVDASDPPPVRVAVQDQLPTLPLARLLRMGKIPSKVGRRTWMASKPAESLHRKRRNCRNRSGPVPGSQRYGGWLGSVFGPRSS